MRNPGIRVLTQAVVNMYCPQRNGWILPPPADHLMQQYRGVQATAEGHQKLAVRLKG
jgi:hypothetical protein